MTEPRRGQRGGRIRIEAKALDVRREEEAPALAAYAFGRSGRLLIRTDLKQGKGELSIPKTAEPEAIRVVVGPRLESDDPQKLLITLTRLEAPETQVRLEDIKEPLGFPIDRVLWCCWLRLCIVRGTLLKRVSTGGVDVDLPVCGADVEIYEVDPVSVIFPKIPVWILERLREVIRRPWPPPPPDDRLTGGVAFPPQPPGAGPDPAPLFGAFLSAPGRAGPAAGAGEVASIRQELTALIEEVGAEGEAPKSAKPAATGSEPPERIFAFETGESTAVEPEEALASVRALADLPEIRAGAASGLSAFRSALLARPELLRPLLCWLWPRAVTMQLVATAVTDECGHFRAPFNVGCSSDVPDLYFKAYRRIGQWRFPIYEPLPVACNTWWDYACGSEVTLITTSPFAHTCPPCQPVIAPEHWVLAMAVGNTSLAAVRGTSIALQPSTNPSNIGLAGPGSGWGDGAPWGADLRLRFEFDYTMRTDLNVRYYRVRWRKAGSGNPFLDLTATQWRHYAHWVGSTLMIEPYKLGPQAVGGTPNVYEMPPALPPVGQWVIADAVWDTTSALFPSGSLAPGLPALGAGLYEFELTLFDAGGAAVNANTLGIHYVVPTTLDLTTTIPTADASLLGLVTGTGRLVFQLHVDNNVCAAALDPPQIGGTVSADPCGLLPYNPGDTVTLKYSASHPNGFATYGHSVVRGATPLPPPISSSGPVGPPPGTHTDADSVSDLLGPCSIAGFAETLSVWAMATDGWSRLSGYDRYAIQAFVLAPPGS